MQPELPGSGRQSPPKETNLVGNPNRPTLVSLLTIDQVLASELASSGQSGFNPFFFFYLECEVRALAIHCCVTNLPKLSSLGLTVLGLHSPQTA